MKKTSLIIGRQPLIEAISSGHAIDKIFFQQGVSGPSIGEIRKLAGKRNIPIQQVPAEKLKSLSRGNHQGVVAMAALVEYLDLQQVIDFVVDQGAIPLLVLLDGVTDVRNIGAIARSALCCGAQAVILPSRGVGALNEEALKSSAGALEKIHVCRVTSLQKATDCLRLNGIHILTSVLGAPKPLYQIDFTLPCCIVMGSEDKGVQSHLQNQSTDQFSIPMASGFNSLNVSVAAGIILYEAMMQRLGRQRNF